MERARRSYAFDMGTALRGALRPWQTLMVGPVGIRVIGEIGGTLTFLLAIAHMPLANAAAIFQALPLVITLGAALVFGLNPAYVGALSQVTTATQVMAGFFLVATLGAVIECALAEDPQPGLPVGGQVVHIAQVPRQPIVFVEGRQGFAGAAMRGVVGQDRLEAAFGFGDALLGRIDKRQIVVGVGLGAGFAKTIKRFLVPSLMADHEAQVVPVAMVGGFEFCGFGQGAFGLGELALEVIAVAQISQDGGVSGLALQGKEKELLGFGVPPPHPSWGSMLSGSGRTYMFRAPWMAIWPGVAISLAVFGFNMLGDALRDVLDPRLRGSR